MQIDPKLLDACRRRDRKAQSELYRRCFGVLMGVCRRYTKQDDEAMDWLNRGFLKVLTHLDKYQPSAPFEAWIRRIMINTIIDAYRRERRYKETQQLSTFETPQEQRHQVDLNTADLQFDAEEVEQMIRALPPMTQQVFNLFAIDGYSHKEIAERLGISDGTSKWHVATARKSIQAKMIAKKRVRQSSNS